LDHRRERPDRDRRQRLEATRAVAEVDRNAAAAEVRGREVELAVAVEVAHGDGAVVHAAGEERRAGRLDGSTRAPEPDRQGEGEEVNDRDVVPLVAVEVADRERHRIAAGRDRRAGRRGERRVRAAGENGWRGDREGGGNQAGEEAVAV